MFEADRSEGVFISPERIVNGKEHDPDVEPDAPVFHIPDVMLHALLHLHDGFGFSTKSIHLSPSGDAGSKKLPYHVLANNLGIVFGVFQHVRPRSYDAHFAFQHIDELRELIDIRATHQAAYSRHARVVLGSLLAIGIVVHLHAPELIASERLIIPATSFLHKEHGPL